jgi:hypothetical protein
VAVPGINPFDPPRVKKKKDSGLRVLVEAGYQIGVGEYNLDRVKFNLMAMHQFNSHYMLGIGGGYRHFVESKRVAVPVFLHFRSIPGEKKVSEYFALSAGYSVEDVKGIMAGGQAGARFLLPNKMMLFTGLEYEVQVGEVQRYWGAPDFLAFGAVGLFVTVAF